MIARVERGEDLEKRYPYGRALREEIIDEHVADEELQPSVVTRNSIGCLVLNSPEVMFIDVDLPPAPAFQWIRRLFGGRDADAEAALALDRVRNALTAQSSSTFRIYRTVRGFRALATERTFVPDSSEAERLMVAIGADRAFVQLVVRSEASGPGSPRSRIAAA